MYTKKQMAEMAENLSNYIDNLDFIVIDGISRDEFKKAKKTTKELIKKLKKGDTSVFDKERCLEMEGNGELNE